MGDANHGVTRIASAFRWPAMSVAIGDCPHVLLRGREEHVTWVRYVWIASMSLLLELFGPKPGSVSVGRIS